MIFDYFTYIIPLPIDPNYNPLEDDTPLASGFIDYCTALSVHNRNKAHEQYITIAKSIHNKYPIEFQSKTALFQKNWFELTISFSLETPWFSKDDRIFHVLDNPLRKDKIFGIPYIEATSWKGLLRWTCRMEAGLLDHLEKNQNSLDTWNDPEWIVHLFGNARGAEEEFNSGALQFFPTWFNKIGFCLINPHSRETRAGKRPIYYEVVPPCTTGIFTLLYAPMPDTTGMKIDKLFDAIEKLITVYGFSAKRTTGWGLAKIENCTIKSESLNSTEECLETVKSLILPCFTASSNHQISDII